MKNGLKILILLLLISCASRDKNGKVLDTPTAGSITIAVDASLKPLIEAEVYAFESIYANAHIKVIYTSEGEAIEALLKDTARMVIVTRRLSTGEEKILADQIIVSKQMTLATSGVALIVNRQNPDSLIQLQDIKKILSGETDRWHKINKTSSSLPMEVVFDHPNSGIIRFLRDSLVAFDSLPSYCFALQSNRAVIDYVAGRPQAIGLIDVSWISDSDDSTANSFLKTIRVVGVARDSVFYQPFQAYIAQHQYPLLREAVMISREARTGLASGFMAFVASDKGQRIVLKSGLVPATMPIRIVEINHEPF